MPKVTQQSLDFNGAGSQFLHPKPWHCVSLEKIADAFLCLSFSFALVSDKRYQRKEPVISSVHSKIKGIAEVKKEIMEQIEYDVLAQRDYSGVLDEIVSLITDTYCSNESYVRIGKREIPIATVRQRLLMLTAEHIEYVINSLERNTTEIKNMRAYMLTSLYNSIDTLEADGLYGN